MEGMKRGLLAWGLVLSITIFAVSATAQESSPKTEPAPAPTKTTPKASPTKTSAKNTKAGKTNKADAKKEKEQTLSKERLEQLKALGYVE